MVTLAEELPFAVVAKDAHLGMVCSSCFASKQDRPISRCIGCKVVKYCNKECQKKDWKDHKNECKFLLNSAPRIPPWMPRLIARVAMKLRRGNETEKPAFNGRVYADLMDHRDEIRKQYSNYVAHLSVVLHDYMGAKFVPDPDLLLSIYGKVRTNCFGVGSEDGGTGTGLFIGLSVHDHSCAPDVHVTYDGVKAVLRSSNNDQKYSKDLTVSYIESLQLSKDRKDELLSNYFFVCTCSLCADPIMDFTFNSIRSVCCPDSYCLLDPDAKELNCNKCGAISDIYVKEAASANEEASLLCKMAKGDLLAEPGTAIHLQSYIELYEYFSEILSPFNLKLLKINDEIVLSAFRLRNHEVGHKYASLHLPAIRGYIPIGDPNHAIRLMKYAITMSRGAEPSQQILEAFEEALATSLVSHGPNHRQTTKMKEWVEYNRSYLQSHGIS